MVLEIKTVVASVWVGRNWPKGGTREIFSDGNVFYLDQGSIDTVNILVKMHTDSSLEYVNYGSVKYISLYQLIWAYLWVNLPF